MTQPDDAVRRIRWTEAFPFTRIFLATRCATAILPMLLCFVALVLAYSGGRLLDGIWLACGAGVPTATFVDDLVSDAADTVPGREAHARLLAELARQARSAGEAPAGSQPVSPQRGPFAILLSHTQHSFSAGIHAVAAGRLGFDGTLYSSAAPSLLSSAASACNGVLWLVTQRPLFALLYAIFLIGLLAYFGGAVCRFVAVRLTLDEDLTLEQALGFAGEKWLQLAGAPLLLIGAFVGVSVLMILGGMVGAIPWLGELFVAVSFPFTLLGGVVLAALVVALVAGFPLIWPTIALEGSDAADGLLKSGGYVRSRPWSAGFYVLLLLASGAVALLVARVLALLVLKLTHAVAGIGIGFFGLVGSSTSTADAPLDKLSGMWSMPAWQQVALLPGVHGDPFWGRFGLGGDLSWSETFCMWFLMLWVFAVVGLVGAYALSYFLSGATGMYLVLRQEVDGVDPREIFYEDPESDWDPPAGAEPGGRGEGGGAAPAAGGPSPGSA